MYKNLVRARLSEIDTLVAKYRLFTLVPRALVPCALVP
jgi:hypothetical protein